MKTFLKGIIVGIGGIAPGLSGSVLMVILGLYEKAINAIATIFNFKKFKENFRFLFPLCAGFGIGIILFSKIVDYLLTNAEMYTRFAFLGLVIGTVPMFFREVKKEGFHKKYYLVMAIAAIAGLALFFFNGNLFPKVTNPNLLQSVLLGVAVAGSFIIPGVDSAVILSALGLYELFVNSVATLNFSILIPAGVGLVISALAISFVMNIFIKKFYTMTFSVIFGLFISIIPNVLGEGVSLGLNGATVISILLAIVGFMISYFLGDIEGNVALLKKWFGKAQ